MSVSVSRGGDVGANMWIVARLMYATGDVPEPDVDAVDYMEDLVVDFLADLVSLCGSYVNTKS